MIAGLLILGCAALIFVSVRNAELSHEAGQRERLLTAVADLRAGAAAAHASWDAAAAGGRRRPWRRTFEIDPAGRPLAAYAGGFGQLAPALRQMVAQLGGRYDEESPVTDSGTNVLSDLVADGEVPSLAVVELDAPAAGDQSAGRVTVSAAPLDLFVPALERASGVVGLAVAAQPTDYAPNGQTLTDQHGRIIGWLTWQASRPVARDVVPLTIALALVGAVLLGLAVWSLRGSGRRGKERADGGQNAQAYWDVTTGLPAMEAEPEERRFLKQELRRALDDGALHLHYQPILVGDGTRICGVEALLRWTHPTRGPIPPNVFVPVAEQTGLMDELGEMVLRQALADALRWPNLYIAVNISPVQMREPGFIDLVAGVIDETGIPASRVVLEVTEGVLIDNPDQAQKRLDALRALGVRVALDDFGVGYSSLSYLQRFPFDKLKIDKQFVAPLGRSANGAVIVQSIVGLGRALGLSVLAEGVETEEQRILLRLAGCNEMQGFLFAKPSPRETIDELVAKVEARAGTARARRGARVG